MPLSRSGSSVRSRSAPDGPDDRVPVRPVGVQALDVREHDELLRPQCDGQRSRCGVGIDVVRDPIAVPSHRRHHRDQAVVEQPRDEVRPDVDDVADLPDVHGLAGHDGVASLGGEQVRILARHPDRVRTVLVDEAHELALDLADEDHPHDVHDLRRRHPQAALELRVDPEAREHRADLRAAAVHDHRPQSREPQEHDVLGEARLERVVGHGVAAVLHHDRRAVEPLQPGQCLGEDGRLGGGVRQVGHVVILRSRRRSSRGRTRPSGRWSRSSPTPRPHSVRRRCAPRDPTCPRGHGTRRFRRLGRPTRR